MEIPVLRYNRTVGTRGKREPGTESQCKRYQTLENPCVNGKTRCGPKESREARELCVKKSHDSLYRTRTVNRLQVDEEEGSKAGGRSIGQGTRQNDPVTSGEECKETWPQRIGSSNCRKQNTGLCETER